MDRTDLQRLSREELIELVLQPNKLTLTVKAHAGGGRVAKRAVGHRQYDLLRSLSISQRSLVRNRPRSRAVDVRSSLSFEHDAAAR